MAPNSQRRRTMPKRTLRLHPFAQGLLDGLSEKERQRILKAATKLLPLDPEDWPQDKVALLRDEEPLYLLRVPPDLCAFVIPEDGVLVLRDVAYEETLQRLSGGRNGAEE